MALTKPYVDPANEIVLWGMVSPGLQIIVCEYDKSMKRDKNKFQLTFWAEKNFCL
jgi:hypothetical protein